MDNLDFDRKIREMMEAHTEEPSVNSWDLIASDLKRRRDTRIRRARRSIYVYSAAAAALLLFVLIGPNIFTEGDSMKVVRRDMQGIDNIRPKVAVIEKMKSPEKLTALKRRGSVGAPSDKTASPGVDYAVDSIGNRNNKEQIVTGRTDKDSVAVAEADTSKGRSTQEPNKSDNRVVRNILTDNLFGNTEEEKIGGKPILALAAGLSPSYAGSYTDPVMMSDSYGVRSNASPIYLQSEAPREEVFEEEYMMPVTVGFQIFFPITQRFSIGTGLNYSFLSTKYSLHSINNGITEHRRVTLHYAGVPINFQYRILSGDRLNFYALGGTTIEKGLTAVDKNIVDGSKIDEMDKIKGAQLSVNVGLGMELALSNSMGLYFDPNITYYFDNKKKPQPFSIRTVQPLLFRFEAGLRFRL